MLLIVSEFGPFANHSDRYCNWNETCTKSGGFSPKGKKVGNQLVTSFLHRIWCGLKQMIDEKKVRISAGGKSLWDHCLHRELFRQTFWLKISISKLCCFLLIYLCYFLPNSFLYFPPMSPILYGLVKAVAFPQIC